MKNTFTLNINIIIPSFNRAEKLKKAIDSVLDQSFPNWELIIVDDRSKDNTKEVVREYSYKDPRIKYYRNEFPQGPAGARNFGLKHAKGKYIAFLDSDDIWLPNHLKECINALENGKNKICCAKWYNNTNNVTQNFYPRQQGLDIALTELNPKNNNGAYHFKDWFCEYAYIRGVYLIKTSFLVFERSLLESSGWFNDKIKNSEDMDFFFRLTMYSGLTLINNFHGICYEGDDNLYFFRNAFNTKDKKIVKKLNFHRRYDIMSNRLMARMIKESNIFIHKTIMLHFTYWLIRNKYEFLDKINKPFNRPLSFLYQLSQNFYDYKYKMYPRLGEKYFYLSFQKRFENQVIYKDFLSLKNSGQKELETNYPVQVFLEKHIYLKLSGNKLLLYNPANGKILTIKNFGKHPIYSSIKNNCIELQSIELKNNQIFSFIKSLYKNYMGGIIIQPQKTEFLKPIQNKKETIKDFLPNGNLLNPEITFYINNDCKESCALCSDAFLQFKHCVKNDSKTELPIHSISEVLKQFRNHGNTSINIIGGNIFKYSNLKELKQLLKSYIPRVNYFINYLHFSDKKNIPDFLKTVGEIKILVQFPIDNTAFNKVLKMMENNQNCEFHFTVGNREEIKKVNKLIVKLNGNPCLINPYFDGNNLNFFKKNVFMDKKEIEANINNKNINKIRYLNEGNIGQIFIRPNGEIFTNLNENSIGNIKTNSLSAIFYSQALEETSWFKTRSNVDPCRDCIYDLFCPGITNYEYFIGHKICRNVRIS